MQGVTNPEVTEVINGMLPAISVNKGCHSSLAVAATASGELVSPEGTQEGKNTCHLVAIRLQPLPTVSPEETQDVKTQNTGPR